MSPSKITKRGWTIWHVAFSILLAAAAVFIAADAWLDLITIALKDEESSHVLLVPVAVLWIGLVRRGTLRNCRPVGYWFGPLLIALGWFLWSFGYKRDVQAFWHGGAIVMAVGAVTTALGSDVVKRLWPAFLVLVFLVPVPGMIRQSVAQPMQTATAFLTQSMGELAGMQVERWGNMLTINDRQVAVAEACNGMRMVFTLSLVSYVFAFTTPLLPYVRAAIVIASPVTAILCNVIRLVPTVWVFGHFPESTAEKFHTFSGWVMLGVGFLLLTGIVRLFRWLMIPVTPFRLAMN